MKFVDRIIIIPISYGSLQILSVIIKLEIFCTVILATNNVNYKFS